MPDTNCSYNNTGEYLAGLCEQPLMELGEVVGRVNDPMLKRTPLGYLQAVKDNDNFDNMEIKYQDANGDIHPVRIRYSARVIEDQIEDDEPYTDDDDCDSNNYPELCEDEIEPTEFAVYRFALKPQEVSKICMGQSAFLMRHINSAFDALAQQINRGLLTAQSVNFGNNYGNGGVNTVKAVTGLQAATGNPYALVVQEIFDDYQVQNTYAGMPKVIGAGNFGKWFRTVEAGCCNDGGVDIGVFTTQNGMQYYIDTMIGEILGNANQICVMAPGTVRMITAHRYDNPERSYELADGTAHTTLIDPVMNIKYDYKVLWDSCKEKYNFIISLNYGSFFIPADAFHPADRLYGTNGTVRYQIDAI